MLANAVMFNAGDGDDADDGDGGVVRDARQMWEDVSKSVEGWRRVSGGVLGRWSSFVGQTGSESFGTPGTAGAAAATTGEDEDGSRTEAASVAGEEERSTIGGRAKRRRL
jgi:hypothetical protein